MARLDQQRRGYLRGIRGVQLTRLDANYQPNTQDSAIVSTATQATFEAIVVDGPREALRGGDRVLAYYAERSHIVGHTIRLVDARGHLLSLYIVQGGTLIEEPDGSDTRIIGLRAPRVGEQHTGPYFEMVAYQASFNVSGGVEGYLRHRWPFCFATVQRFNIADQEWTAPEIEVTAVEMPDGSKPFYEVEFVDAAQVPPELVW